MLSKPESEVGSNIKDFIKGRQGEFFTISRIKHDSNILHYLNMSNGKEAPFPLYDYEIILSQTEWDTDE